MSRKAAEDFRHEVGTAGPDAGLDAEFDAAVEEFRIALDSAANRPEGFWNHQRASVISRTDGRPPRPLWRMALVWSVTIVFVVIVVGIVLDRPQAAPAPDLAVGYDQELLVDVERSLDREVPEPLEAAFLLTAEIKRNSPTLDSGGRQNPGTVGR
jgi:hypothetical protein